MSDKKYCSSCGAEVEEGKRFCPECGEQVGQQEAEISPASPVVGGDYSGAPRGTDKRAMDHITIGYTVALEQPQVFLPAVISGALGLAVSFLTGTIGLGDTLSTLIGLTVSILSFILNFASIDMSRDAYYRQPLDLMDSVNYVVGRFLTFFLAAIFGGLLSITIVLIPVVLFMFVIMVMDETGVMDAFKKSFNVIQSDLKDVIILLFLSIVASVIVGFVPLISTLLSAVVNVIFGIAFIDIYATYRMK